MDTRILIINQLGILSTIPYKKSVVFTRLIWFFEVLDYPNTSNLCTGKLTP